METILALLVVASVFGGFIIVQRSRRLVQETSDQNRTYQEDAASWRAACQSKDAMLAKILAHTADALIVTDASRRITHCSPRAEKLFEIPAEKALGKPFIEVVRDADLDDLLRSCLSSKSTLTRSVRLALSHRLLEATAAPLMDGHGGTDVLVVIKDVTELRKLETARREFVANISHELRVPLAAIKAMVETLHDGALSDTKVARRFLSQINAEIDNLTQLVRELLELSRIESGQSELRMAPANVNEMVERAIDRLQVQADQQGVRITVESFPGDAVVVLDEDRVGQVILNLLHNAIKFTPKDGQVRVRASKHPEGPTPVLRISVEDTGVGISEEDLPRIFERFYKVDKARKRGEGTGLGLAIAKHIIQAHGGQIWAESEEGRGSTFAFTLPLEQPASGRA